MQQMVVDGQKLVRERVDERRFSCECAVEQICVREAMRLGHIPHDFAVGAECSRTSGQKLKALLGFRQGIDEGLQATALGFIEPELDDTTETLDGPPMAPASHALVQQARPDLDSFHDAHVQGRPFRPGPCSSSSQWSCGYAYGVLTIGRTNNMSSVMDVSLLCHELAISRRVITSVAASSRAS